MDRNRFFNKIHPTYLVDVEEIAKSLGVPFEENKVDFSVISDKTEEELKKILLYSVSWLENLNYKKSLLKGAILKNKESLNVLQSKKYKDIKNALISSANYKRVTVSDVETEIDSDPEIIDFREKISLYEAYYEYVSGLYDVLELLHYSVKTLIGNVNDIWKKSKF